MATENPYFPFPLSDLGPCELSWSFRAESGSSRERIWVFWSRYNDELRYQMPLLLASQRYNVTGMIRCALQGLGPRFLDESYLIQFWGLVNIGESMYLTTCDQPFALTAIDDRKENLEGLCRYRKNCLEYLIAVDDETSVREGELGPPGRVFRSGLPESIFDVSLYSSQEYPQRDKCLKYYLALPVYQSPGHICVGVLEIVSTEIDVFDAWDECADSLEDAGLRTIFRFYSECYLKSNSCHEVEIDKINNALKEVCKACPIPVAEMWIGTNSEEQLLTIFVDSWHGQCGEWFCNTNRSCFIRKGHGVVGKAFSSQGACFCRDITQLSITEYALIPSVRQYKFSSCFAICLQSCSCSDSCIYTLEFFLPTNETNSEVASEVIKVSSDDELDSFEICRTNSGESTPEIVEVQNQVGMMLPNGSFHQVDAANNSVHDINVQQNVFVGSPPTSELVQNLLSIRLVQNLLSITHRQTIEKLDAAIPPSDDATMKHNGNEVTNLKKRGSANYTLEGARGITLNDLQQRSAMKLVDAAEDLEVSRSTLKRICRRYDIKRWPPHKARKYSQASDQQEFAQPSKKNVEKHSMPAATRLQDDSIIMVKATYGDDIIKFNFHYLPKRWIWMRRWQCD